MRKYVAEGARPYFLDPIVPKWTSRMPLRVIDSGDAFKMFPRLVCVEKVCSLALGCRAKILPCSQSHSAIALVYVEETRQMAVEVTLWLAVKAVT